MKRRRYNWMDDEPHGTRELAWCLIDDTPAMSNGRVARRCGRAMMRRIAARCDGCMVVDALRAARRRMHSAYSRRRGRGRW